MDADGRLDADLDFLCRQARELGASQCASLPAADVVVDERAWLKCLVPLCPHYGRDLLCPPSVPPVSHFREALKNYRQAIIIKVDVACPDAADGKNRESFKTAKMRLYKVIGRLEALCLERGHHFAAGLAGGSCDLCDECVGIGSGLPCRHPFEARPSMEALGIDVFATVRKVGLTLSFAGTERSWIGLLLVC